MSEKEEAKPAEEAVEPPKKKKGKLPVLIALVAILGGGGFFAMKLKGGAKPKVELGEVVQLQEILVNLKEPNTYARTDISFHLAKGFDKTKLEAKIDAVRDAIILSLSSKSLSQVRTMEGKLAFKKEIAASVNGLLADAAHPPAKEAAPKPKDGEKKPDEAHADWDSPTGPVLKVYFSNFATQ